MTRRKPDVLTLSSEGLCLSMLAMGQVKRLPELVLTLQSPWGSRKKAFSVAQVHDRKWGGREYLIDRQTGTLYDSNTGECLTTAQLRVLGKP